MNDPAEKCFGAMTGKLRCFDHISLSHAGAVGQVRINGYLSRGFDADSKNKSVQMGIFHNISNKIRLYLLTVSLEDAQAIRNLEIGDLLKHIAAKHRK